MTYSVSTRAAAPAPRQSRAASAWLWLVALAGGVHAGMTFYWAAGGRWLLWSLSSQIVGAFANRMWLLWPVGLVKAVAAVGPLLLARSGWPWRRLSRGLCWLAAAVLIMWGGLNTAVGNLVLTGLVRPAGGYDRPDMIGHAWLWDPIFLVWGLALALGLRTSRHPRPTSDAARPSRPADHTTR